MAHFNGSIRIWRCEVHRPKTTASSVICAHVKAVYISTCSRLRWRHVMMSSAAGRVWICQEVHWGRESGAVRRWAIAKRHSPTVKISYLLLFVWIIILALSDETLNLLHTQHSIATVQVFIATMVVSSCHRKCYKSSLLFLFVFQLVEIAYSYSQRQFRPRSCRLWLYPGYVSIELTPGLLVDERGPIWGWLTGLWSQWIRHWSDVASCQLVIFAQNHQAVLSLSIGWIVRCRCHCVGG